MKEHETSKKIYSEEECEQKVYEALTIQALRMRKEVFNVGGMDLETFDNIYLDEIGEYEKKLAEREGISLNV